MNIAIFYRYRYVQKKELSDWHINTEPKPSRLETWNFIEGTSYTVPTTLNVDIE